MRLAKLLMATAFLLGVFASGCRSGKDKKSNPNVVATPVEEEVEQEETEEEALPDLVLLGVKNQVIDKNNKKLSADISHNDKDVDDKGAEIEYSCLYDNKIDEKVLGSSPCSELEGFSFDGATGVMSWEPSFKLSGDYEIKILGQSQNQKGETLFSVVVTGVDYAPVLSKVSDQIINSKQSIATINVNDGDDDKNKDGKAIAYSCFFDNSINSKVSSKVPCSQLKNVSFNSKTGVMNWSPERGQENQYEFKIIGAVGDGSDSVIFMIDVKEPVFRSVWKTDFSGASRNDQISLPLVASGSYDFNVDWGDGTSSHITSWNSPDVLHTYEVEGVYELKITGKIKGFSFADEGDDTKLLEVREWGRLNLGNTGDYFHGAGNLKVTAEDELELAGTTNLEGMFRECKSLTSVPGMNNWQLGHVTTTEKMFADAPKFNEDIGNWDVSKVTDMGAMFYGADAFNKNISEWNVGNVTKMDVMFAGATSFNQDISKWNVSKVATFQGMFSDATSFNQPIGSWNVTNVLFYDYMFKNATAFDQDLSGWKVERAISMIDMFNGATLSTGNYDAMLNSWGAQAVRSNVLFNAGNSTYSEASEDAREVLTDDKDWNIKDGGEAVQ